MKRGTAVLALLLLAGCSAHQPAPYPCDAVPARALVKVKRAGPVERAGPRRYLVMLREGRAARSMSLAATARATGTRTLAAVPGFAATMAPARAAELARDPDVLFVQEVGPKTIPPGEERVPGSRATTPAAGTRLPNLDRLDQRDLPLDGEYGPRETGRGVHIYVIDTGIETTHPELAGRVGAGFFSIGDGEGDEHGHGTHVAGTAAGTSVGVATGAVVHPVRVMDRDGRGDDETVVRGIDFVVGDVERNRWPAVANLSLGGPESPAVDLAIGRLRQAGVAVAVAAGNDSGEACGRSPARAECALTVGASEIWSGDGNEYRARFTNVGRCVDLFALGVDVLSAWLGGTYERRSGTSMATPAVSGLLALCFERGASDAQACVLETATRGRLRGIDEHTPNLQGYCLPDVEARAPAGR